LRHFATDQREQRQAATFALIVGAHDHAHVLDRHHDHHRPEDQAQHAMDVRGRGRDRIVTGERFAKGVNRTRADVPEHDPYGAHGQL
jgi:hypothetical protein